MTVSRLILTPKSEDDGSHLICRVKNSMISGSVVEESVKLDIHCKSKTVSIFHAGPLMVITTRRNAPHETYNVNKEGRDDVGLFLSCSDPPEVRIALGSNINGDDVKEGDDLYIECHIRANPAFYKLQWTHNVCGITHHARTHPLLPRTSPGKSIILHIYPRALSILSLIKQPWL